MLDEFHTVLGDDVRITADQASRFAKEVAGDFNPIHDPDARRFCVPGDLLFALVLSRYGLSARMTFSFRGMVGRDVPLRFPDTASDAFDIAGPDGKAYLHVQRAGPVTRDPTTVEAVIRRYVAFSGRNFPHFLQPLMAEKQVMFNPDRPLVIYDSMGFELELPDASAPDMELADASLAVAGKRGDATLHFRITSGGETIGTGTKRLVVSGLREYDERRMREFMEDFERRRQDYR